MKASVLMITYNHERFIVQAVESALAQQTTFDYEVVIGEDCSTENTRALLVDLQKRHPERIRLLLPEQNMGAHRNFAQALRACQGEYVALLEGDDYWTSPQKLQEQVDFLDTHPECAICFHNVRVIYQDGSRPPRDYSPPHQKEISTIRDLLISNFVPTCSTMFRRDKAEYPDWLFSLKMGDWPFHILNARHGKIGYIGQVMAVYRIHAGGLWNAKNPIEKLSAFAQMHELLITHLDSQYAELLARVLAGEYFRLALAYDRGGEIARARAYVRKALAQHPFRGRIPKRGLLLTVYMFSPLPWLLAPVRRFAATHNH
jgi:glycosyltransferase involved in cell wall biosynthesis